MAGQLTQKGKKIISIVGGIAIAVVVVGITAGCLANYAKQIPFEDGYGLKIQPIENGKAVDAPISYANANNLSVSFHYDNQGPQWNTNNQPSNKHLNKVVDLRIMVAWLYKKHPPTASIMVKTGTFNDTAGANFGEYISCQINLLKEFPGLGTAVGPQRIRINCWDCKNNCWVILGDHNFCYFFKYNGISAPEHNSEIE